MMDLVTADCRADVEIGYIDVPDTPDSPITYRKLFLSEYLDDARMLATGYCDEHIAALHFKTDIATIRGWMALHDEFAQLINQGKQTLPCLFQKAAGYERLVIRIRYGMAVELVEHVPSDLRAIMFYLKAKKPKEWGGSPPTRYEKASAC